MTDLARVIGSGVTRVLGRPYFLGDEDKARLPGSTIAIAPHHNPQVGGWVVGGYWHMCDDGVLALLGISAPAEKEAAS